MPQKLHISRGGSMHWLPDYNFLSLRNKIEQTYCIKQYQLCYFHVEINSEENVALLKSMRQRSFIVTLRLRKCANWESPSESCYQQKHLNACNRKQSQSALKLKFKHFFLKLKCLKSIPLGTHTTVYALLILYYSDSWENFRLHSLQFCKQITFSKTQ